MILKKCILTENDCYKRDNKISGKPFGIVVHSTGAPNKTLKRYVQPVEINPAYNEIIADLGKNIYDNDWNKSISEMGRAVCVHAFIGVNEAGKVETYQTLPFDICCWGVGRAGKGSFNYNPTAKIQFEICEDDLNDKNYFNAAFKEAIEFCAYLCEKLDISVSSITSHAESYSLGYGSNHGDCDHWLKKFGYTMAWFRAEVKKILDEKNNEQPANDVPIDGQIRKVQVGAFKDRSNADALLNKLREKNFNPYYVFEDGLYKVRAGAFINKSNAEALVKKLGTSGFESFITGDSPTNTTTVPKPEPIFKTGDQVRIKSGVKKFADGITMQSWVGSVNLYIRAVEKDGSVLLLSTEKTKNEYTGRVNSSDVYKI